MRTVDSTCRRHDHSTLALPLPPSPWRSPLSAGSRPENCHLPYHSMRLRPIFSDANGFIFGPEWRCMGEWPWRRLFAYDDSVGDNLSNVELKSLFTAYACILDMSARPIMMDFQSDRHFFFLGDSPSLSQFCTPVLFGFHHFNSVILKNSCHTRFLFIC